MFVFHPFLSKSSLIFIKMKPWELLDKLKPPIIVIWFIYCAPTTESGTNSNLSATWSIQSRLNYLWHNNWPDRSSCRQICSSSAQLHTGVILYFSSLFISCKTEYVSFKTNGKSQVRFLFSSKSCLKSAHTGLVKVQNDALSHKNLVF